MKGWRCTLSSLLMAVAPVIGCGHAKTVEPAVPPAEAKAEAKAKAKKTEPERKPVEREAPKSTAATFTSHHAAKDDGDEGEVKLSTSPTALLKPGALKTIQERLASAGELEGEPSGTMDGRTRKALEEFQRHHDLPATGIPDDATVGRLGLKPAEIFR